MHYKFVEIGCCDFNTQCDTLSEDTLGLCVDPIGYYLENLPKQSNLIKDNSAISNKQHEVMLYYVPEKTILLYNLPIWLKGCNRIENLHPTVVKELQSRNLPLELIQAETILTKTYENLILQHKCTNIEYLKIDTEGNEPAIIDSLYNFYKYNNSLLKYNKPSKINIEAFTGILVSDSDIETAKNQLFDLGYVILEINPPDIIFVLK